MHNIIKKAMKNDNIKQYEYSKDAFIAKGDNLALLSSLPDESIDLIFADPPYNIGKDFGNGSDSWVSEKEYFDWCYKWIEECFRVLKKDGTFYISNSTQNMPYFDIYIRERWHITSRIVWTYDSSGAQAKKKFGSLYEPIIMCTKSKNTKYTFNAQDILVEAKSGSQRKLINYRKNPPEPYATEKVPGNVWEFSRVRFKMAEYEKHPSQKPESLLERVIKASSNPGDIVLDPFGGTFSTAAVAKRLGRKSISIDLNEEYYKIGLRRVLNKA